MHTYVRIYHHPRKGPCRVNIFMCLNGYTLQVSVFAVCWVEGLQSGLYFLRLAYDFQTYVFATLWSNMFQMFLYVHHFGQMGFQPGWYLHDFGKQGFNYICICNNFGKTGPNMIVFAALLAGGFQIRFYLRRIGQKHTNNIVQPCGQAEAHNILNIHIEGEVYHV